MDTVYYTEFMGQQIFASASVNLFFDRLFTTLANAIGSDKLVASVYLDGEVALELQKVIRNVSFVSVAVNDANVYKLLLQYVRALDVSSIVVEQYNTTVYVAGYPIKFYKATWPIVMINNIPVRDLNSFNI